MQGQSIEFENLNILFEIKLDSKIKFFIGSISIDKLEKLYKNKKYTHKRIWQVGMIMKVRLEVLKEKKPEEYKLAKRYFEFLSKRTKMDEDDRHTKVFK